MSRRARLVAVVTALLVVQGARTAAAEVSSPHPGTKLVRGTGQAMLVVDLCAPGVSIRATKYSERKKTAETWGQEVGAQAALNADFFDNPAVTYVIGRARGDGEDWPANAQNKEDRQYWQFGPGEASLVLDNSIVPPAAPQITEVIGSHNAIVKEGVRSTSDKPLLVDAYRRTAFGLSEDRRTLYLYASHTTRTMDGIIDGMFALAEEAGAPQIWWATNEDGGGSSQLWVEGEGQVISATRLVANHIGVFASGSGPATHCVQKYAAEYAGRSFLSADQTITLEVGETLEGWFELTNVGTATWSTTTTKIAPIPRDAPSPLRDPSWENDHRATAVDAETAPGEVGRFTFVIRGNEVGEGTYAFGLVEEAQAWFADAGGPPDDEITLRVRVVAPTNPTTTGPAATGSSATGGASTGGAGGGATDGGGGEGCDCRIEATGGDRARGLTVLFGLSLVVVRIRRRRARPV